MQIKTNGLMKKKTNHTLQKIKKNVPRTETVRTDKENLSLNLNAKIQEKAKKLNIRITGHKINHVKINSRL